MSTTAMVSYPKIINFTPNRKSTHKPCLKEMPDDLFLNSIGSNVVQKNCMCCSREDDITIKNIESQIKYHEDAIKELDKNDPNYKNDLEYHTEKLRELREELKNLKNDNRNFALKAFKEVLEATGNFIKNIGTEAFNAIIGFFFPTELHSIPLPPAKIE